MTDGLAILRFNYTLKTWMFYALKKIKAFKIFGLDSIEDRRAAEDSQIIVSVERNIRMMMMMMMTKKWKRIIVPCLEIVDTGEGHHYLLLLLLLSCVSTTQLPQQKPQQQRKAAKNPIIHRSVIKSKEEHFPIYIIAGPARDGQRWQTFCCRPWMKQNTAACM